jgi:hypothetical protein
MKLDSLLKTSLDELRMQMLGAQVLFGFSISGALSRQFRLLAARGSKRGRSSATREASRLRSPHSRSLSEPGTWLAWQFDV